MNVPFKAVAKGYYETKNDLELSVSKDQKLNVSEVKDREWFVTDEDGRTGWVPSRVLSRVNAKGEKVETKPEPLDENACAACRNAIEADYMLVAGKKLHPDCFTCVNCNKGLEAGYIPEGEYLYCPDCYYKSFSLRCAACDGVINAGYIVAMDKPYHEDHFVCTTCKKPFAEGKFHEYEGKPYCEADFLNNFAEKCNICSKPIQGLAFEVFGATVHIECFTCKAPGKEHKIAEGTEFHEFNKDIYCHEHFLSSFAEKCSACDQFITAEYVSIANTNLHQDCFKCANCGTSLKDGEPIDILKEAVFCRSCSTKVKKSTRKVSMVDLHNKQAVRIKKKSNGDIPQPRFGNVKETTKAEKIDIQKDEVPNNEQKNNANKAEGKADDFVVDKFYPLSVLQDKNNLPKEVHVARREMYLDDAEFKKVFKMDKQGFRLLKKWKQKSLKQRAKIW